jgi:WD40 repeat protein
MDTPASPSAAVGRMIAAYKLLLAQAAEQLGARPETWGQGEAISREDEERRLAGEGTYRLSPVPYPGLRSFEPNEGEFFFGRDRAVADVQSRLARQRIVVVLGGSGSGKSSLLRAGLLPYLNTKRRIPGREGCWYHIEFRPRRDPMRELADALADQWLLPFVYLDIPDLNKTLGVPRDAPKENARSKLRGKIREVFDEARTKGRKAVLDALLDIANTQLDEYDRLATEGLRVPGPSLLLLLDQFEEVFRPEVPGDARESLLNLIVDLHTYLKGETHKGGLFLAVTMRSEELHRCTEHRGLSEVINSSLYLLELLDPADPLDAADLRRAIVQPARYVLDDWGLEYDRSHPDAPFAPGMPGWLLAGARRLSRELEHRPDQLPLLQHAVQASWHAAIRRWSAVVPPESRLEIKREDLPGQPDGGGNVPDLGSCLRERVNKAAERAAKRFADVGGTTPANGGVALRAAFRALARRDDRGTWARRFGRPQEMKAFMAADPGLRQITEEAGWEALRQALHVFLLRGYLTGGDGRPYDISHEALIRNWPKFQEWLRDLDEVAFALGRILTEVEPATFKEADDATKSQLIHPDVASKVAAVGGNGWLPEVWGEEQIAPTLIKPLMRDRWGEKDEALHKVIALSSEADHARQRVKTASIRSWWTRAALIFGMVVALSTLTVVEVRYFSEKVRTAELQVRGAAGRLPLITQTLADLRRQEDSLGTVDEKFKSEAELASQTSKDRHADIEAQSRRLENRRSVLQARIKDLEEGRGKIISELDKYNKELWNSKSASAKEQVFASVSSTLTQNKTLTSAGKLRVAIYALSAIPENEKRLNEALRNAIVEYVRTSFTVNGQIWGVAFDPVNRYRAAIGDDQGVVRIFDPVANVSLPRELTAASGEIVNGLAFSPDGKFLAAAYRTHGAVVWDLGTGTQRCSLGFDRASGSDAPRIYNVAFAPDGKTLAVASSDHTARLWDLSDPSRCPQLPQVFHHDDEVFGVAFSSDGRMLATASGDGSFAVWKLGLPLESPQRFKTGKAVFSVSFSHTDPELIAASGDDGQYGVWDIQKGEKSTKEMPALTGQLGQIALSPDGQLVATAGADGTAIVAEVGTGRLRKRLTGNQPFFGLAFSPDSEYLLIGTLDGTVRLWKTGGDKGVVPEDREELLPAGVKRVIDMTLTIEECQTLRNMQIPILAVAERDWSEAERNSVCAIPALVAY